MSETTPAVSVSPARPDQKPLIAGLAQFYIYDFSEMEPAPSAGFAFTSAGGYLPLPGFNDFWVREGFHALTIRYGDAPAGFALLNTHSHLTGGEVERNIAEFFVARMYRRQGVAMEAVRLILAAYPGHWEIAVAERNAAAKAFWPKAIAAARNVSGLVRHDGDGQHWLGPIWSFDAA